MIFNINFIAKDNRNNIKPNKKYNIKHIENDLYNTFNKIK